MSDNQESPAGEQAEEEPVFFSFGISFECQQSQLIQLSELVSRITAGVALEGVTVRTSISPVQLTHVTSLSDFFAGMAEQLEDDEEENDDDE